MERNREQQLMSLSKVINTLQSEERYELYNDIMNLVQLYNELREA